MWLLLSLTALLVIVASAIFMVGLQGITLGWPLLGLAALPVLAAVLLVLRHAYAEAFLRMTAVFWAPLLIAYLFGILLGGADGPRPEWALIAGLVVLVAGAASVVALVAGHRHLRAQH
ncbi:MAG TPA: hypothetical protein VHK28_05985 [Candidatus Limnocylindria bacterium]|nr:hypothetical protein [Candidatus Limnocylindria bacterium]